MTDGKAFRKAKAGRPLKISDELIEKICAYLRHGAYVETAAAANGITKKTFYEWLKLGNAKPKSIYGRLCDAVEKAMAEGEIHDLLAVTKARSKNWQASAWRLQRRHPERWSATHRPAVPPETDPNQSTFTLNYNLDDDVETSDPAKEMK